MKQEVSMVDPYISAVPVASSLLSTPVHYLDVVGDVCPFCDHPIFHGRTNETAEREHFVAISTHTGEKFTAEMATLRPESGAALKTAKAGVGEKGVICAEARRVADESTAAQLAERLPEQRDARLLSRVTDEDLLARIARSDSAAIREMVARKLPRLLALAARILGDRMEAEDVAQEAFLRTWRQAANWETGRARFDTWLYAVALNLCRDVLSRRRELYAAQLPETADLNSAPDRGLQDRDNTRTVDSAVAMLPERQRKAVVLRYYEQLSNIEAAAVMGISVEALESLLARARRNLRACLENAELRV